MPPNRALGDLGVPVAFELARRLKRAPRQIAKDLADGWVASTASVGSTRRRTAISIFSRPGRFLEAQLAGRPDGQPAAEAESHR